MGNDITLLSKQDNKSLQKIQKFICNNLKLLEKNDLYKTALSALEEKFKTFNPLEKELIIEAVDTTKKHAFLDKNVEFVQFLAATQMRMEREASDQKYKKQGKRTDLEIKNLTQSEELPYTGKESSSLPVRFSDNFLNYYSKKSNNSFYQRRFYLWKCKDNDQFEEILTYLISKLDTPNRKAIRDRSLVLQGISKKEEEEKRRKEAKERKDTKESKEKLKEFDLYNLPISELHTKIKANSVDLILTDPPYEEKSLHLFGELSLFAGFVLKPGGSLLCMTGDMFLPEVINKLSMCQNINWQFLIHYITKGPAANCHNRKVKNGAKSVLWYVKGKYKGEWIYNSVESELKGSESTEKTNEYHKWGQTISGQLNLLKGFAFPGMTICDPFVGAGSSAIASYIKGCKFIGSDIDPDCLKITRGRLIKETEMNK